MAIMAIAALVMVSCQGDPVLKTQEGKLLNEIQTNVMNKTPEQAEAYLTSKGYVSMDLARAPKKKLTKVNTVAARESATYAKVDSVAKEVQMVNLNIWDKKVVAFEYLWEYATAPDKSVVLNVMNYAEEAVKPFDTFYGELTDKKEHATEYAEFSKAFLDSYKQKWPEDYEEMLEEIKEYAGYDIAAMKEAVNQRFSSILWMEANWVKITNWEEMDNLTTSVGLENVDEGFLLYYSNGAPIIYDVTLRYDER